MAGSVLPFVATLRELLNPAERVRPGERCELCDAILSDEHGHIVDTRTRRLLCVCGTCGTPGRLASAKDATAESRRSAHETRPHEGGPAPPEPLVEGGRYRAVPMRYVRLPRMTLSPADWEAFGIPVDLAFFFFNSDLDRIVACYPGPAGAVESLLPLDAWSAIGDRNPSIHTLVPDVEALLVRRADDGYATFIVPIDACYELVGRIRRAWTGFGGGDTAQRAIETFFAAILEMTVDGSASGTFRRHEYGREHT